MGNQLHTWTFIQSSLQSGDDVILFYVVESVGSSPGRQGFFMAVTEKHEIAGSIGGGIMEHKFLQLAKTLFLQDFREVEVRKQIHNKLSKHDQSGMICSGEQTLVICPLGKQDLSTISSLVLSFANRVTGTLQLDKSGLSFHSEVSPEALYFQSGEEWQYRERTGDQRVLHLIGGGHCALALSQHMQLLGFHIRLYEDRENLHTLSENHFAREIVLMDNYFSLAELIPDNSENDYAVVMTFGYRTDMIAIKILLAKRFRYLGLMGSQNKISEMLKNLRADNISEESIHKMYSPAGINIKSKTPDEIAISIAAQIIQVKNQTS